MGALSQESVVRAATLGYPLAMPILGGTLPRYAQLAALYRNAWAESGRALAEVRIAAFAHLKVTETSRETREGFFPYYSRYLEPLFKGPMPRQAFEQMLSPQGSLIGGSVAEVVDKLSALREAAGITRFVGQIDMTEVAPRPTSVRDDGTREREPNAIGPESGHANASTAFQSLSRAGRLGAASPGRVGRSRARAACDAEASTAAGRARPPFVFEARGGLIAVG